MSTQTMQFQLPYTEPTTQGERVLAVLLDGRWWTLPAIKAETMKRFGRIDSEAGISARIREHEHEKRIVAGYSKFFEYRLKFAEVQ